MDTQGLDEFIHPPSGDSGEVAVSNNGDQRRLGSFSALEQPVGEICARAQFWDSNIHCADPGISGPVAVTVALGEPVGTGLAPLRPDHGIGVC